MLLDFVWLHRENTSKTVWINKINKLSNICYTNGEQRQSVVKRYCTNTLRNPSKTLRRWIHINVTCRNSPLVDRRYTAVGRAALSLCSTALTESSITVPVSQTCFGFLASVSLYFTKATWDQIKSSRFPKSFIPW